MAVSQPPRPSETVHQLVTAQLNRPRGIPDDVLKRLRQVRCLALPVIGRTCGSSSYANLGQPAPEASS